MMGVSVIIPTRNEEKLLGGCLEQFTPEIRKQFNIEVIVSDGGSTDGTLAIAQSFDCLIATAANTTHRQNIAEGRNEGALLATKDVFIFLNADSRIPSLPLFLDHTLNRFSHEPGLVALAVKVQIDPNERILSDILFHGFFNQYVRMLNVLGMGMGRGECQIVRSSVFHSSGGYDPHLVAGEDFEFYKRLRKHGLVQYDDKLLVYESPRRYRKYGYLKVYGEWVKNGVSVLLRKQSVSTEWEDVR